MSLRVNATIFGRAAAYGRVCGCACVGVDQIPWVSVGVSLGRTAQPHVFVKGLMVGPC